MSGIGCDWGILGNSRELSILSICGPCGFCYIISSQRHVALICFESILQLSRYFEVYRIYIITMYTL